MKKSYRQINEVKDLRVPEEREKEKRAGTETD